MWQFEHSVESKQGSAQEVWKIWSDVENWSQWDPQIEWSRCDGPFEKGSTIELKPRGAPKTQGKITELDPHNSFTITASLGLGTKIVFIHRVEEESRGVRITHGVTISGPLTPVFEGLLSRHIKEGVPISMQNLVQLLKD